MSSFHELKLIFFPYIFHLTQVGFDVYLIKSFIFYNSYFYSFSHIFHSFPITALFINLKVLIGFAIRISFLSVKINIKSHPVALFKF